MTEQIAQTLVSTIGNLVPTFYSEAETESYPFCVFSQSVTPAASKDGVYKLTSECTVNIVSDSFDEADGIANQVKAAVSASMNSAQFWTTLLSSEKSCEEGVWVLTLEYRIIQKS